MVVWNHGHQEGCVWFTTGAACSCPARFKKTLECRIGLGPKGLWCNTHKGPMGDCVAVLGGDA